MQANQLISTTDYIEADENPPVMALDAEPLIPANEIGHILTLRLNKPKVWLAAKVKTSSFKLQLIPRCKNKPMRR